MPYTSIPRLLLTIFLFLQYRHIRASVAAAQAPPVIGEAYQASGPNDPGTIPGTNISYAKPTGGSSAAVTEYTPASWWLAKVIISGRTFNLAVDTGSADLWVYGPRWTLAPGVGSLTSARPAHTTYDCIRGATANCSPTGTFNITYTYGFGASGNIISDTVNISNNIISNMGVGVAVQVGQIALDAAPSPDGFLGLGFQALSRAEPRQPTFMERLMSKLPQPIFTVDFIPQPGGNNVAEIDFGYINPNKMNGDLYTAPINNSTGHWLVENVTFVVGDLARSTDLAVPGSFSQSMIFDTGGSSLIDVNPIVAASYYSGVPGAYNVTTPTSITWYFNCNATLPDLTLRIGNGTAVYPASQLNLQLGAGSCEGPIGSWTTLGGGPGNLGAAFFANYFVIFNQAGPEVQYAQSLAALEGVAAQKTTSQQRRARVIRERKAGVDESKAEDLMMLAEFVD